MGHSPLLGTDPAPAEPPGRDSGSLGTSDNSDSGSDLAGVGDGGGAGLPLEETLQEAEQRDVPADLDADRVVTPHRDAADPQAAQRYDDEDPDLAFIDLAQAGDPLEDEDTAASADGPDRPNPEPDGPAPTEPTDPDAPPAEPEDSEDRKPGKT